MFAELRIKTNYSFLEGSSHPDEIIDRALEIDLDAIAITDINGVYGLPKAFWRAKETKLKLISGAELKINKQPNITLLASNRAAYASLCQIITAAHAGKEKGKALLELSELAEIMRLRAEQGLYCLLREGADYVALKKIFQKKLLFPLGRFLDGHDQKRQKTAEQVSQELSIPIVASNDVLFHIPQRKCVQDVFVSIREQKTLLNAGYDLLANNERYLKSPFEMRLLFRDKPEYIQSAVQVAEDCNFSLSELKYRYPSEWIPKNHSAQSYLEELTYQGARDRYKNITEAVEKQLRHELKLIAQLSFADYFLTIYDIVAFAKSRDILCQGRGSAANSAVCYCLGITAVDPVLGNLLFERFISVERKEPPDIDVDFEHERREEVIQYIYQKYGRHRAAMVSAVITYQTRSAFREVAKAFAIPVGTHKAKVLLKDFDKFSKDCPIPDCQTQIQEIAREIAGFPRHISIHSGGFTLSADPITDIVPVEPARMEGRTIVQWDKNDLDYLGLLKIDILALGMLSALKKTLDLVGMKLHEIPIEDKETYKMIQKADTVGTFQVESRAQMNMSGRLMPRTFYDLVIQVAIVRPGPIVGKMVHPYLRRRRGLEPVIYPHPKLREILGKTLGVPLFQEQLMKIAIELGDFTPGEADFLRRAIGAWRASGSIETAAKKLLIGLEKKAIPKEYSLFLLEHMKGFAHYGFPESHAASFALLTYASCYLKRYFPAEFTCGLLNSWPMGFYAPHTLVDDAKLQGVRVLPVSINFSDWDCTIENGALRIGLCMVRGLSKKQGAQMVEQRPYKSIHDFLSKNKMRADLLQSLVMGDAFAEFGLDQRHSLWQILNLQLGEETQLGLFDSLERDRIENLFSEPSEFNAVKFDYDAYGLSTKNHPMNSLRKIRKLPRTTTAEAKRQPPKTFVKTSGLLLVRQRPPTANGVCFAAIEDEYGFLDLVLFKKVFEKYREVFLHHCFLVVSGFIERDGHSVSMVVRKIESIWAEEAVGTQGLYVEPTQYFW